jgi:ABC-2 type transport system ATP-binding protein
MSSVIQVKNLRQACSMAAVKDISFKVAEEEIFGLLGPSGAIKTTTVKCLQGLRRPDAGYIRVPGYDPQSEKAELRRHIGSQL